MVFVESRPLWLLPVPQITGVHIVAQHFEGDTDGIPLAVQHENLLIVLLVPEDRQLVTVVDHGFIIKNPTVLHIRTECYFGIRF